MRLVLAGLLLALMLGLQQLHAHFPADLGSRATLAFGFLMLTGFLLGEVLARWVPRITGYLLAGMAFGPHALGLVGSEVVEHFRLVDELALVLIALTAGAELSLERIRARLRGILGIAFVQTGVVLAATTCGLWALSGWLSPFDGLGPGAIWALAALLGIIATATSPSTAVAIIVEARAKGPLTDAVLGVTVIKDILVLAGFSLVLAAGLPALAPGAAPPEDLWHLLLEVGLSLVAGGLFGGLMTAYLRFVGRQTVLFVVGSAFLLISLCQAFELDPLLAAVAAGFAVRNFSNQGEQLLHSLERAAGPVFLIFFCLAGAGLNLAALGSMWRVALVFIGLRASTTWLGTWLGASLVRDPPAVKRFAWTGFLGQAGVSLGLAALLRARLPEVGAVAADLIVGAIVVNQIVGPVAFRWALQRTGEARRRG